jgi:NTP pyrophosphatase (non-canonical NTP hydrolase)
VRRAACPDTRIHARADSAAAEHRQRRLLLLAFRVWRSGAHALYRERMHAELDARWADASESESQKYDSLVQGLKAELAECRSALAREEGARADVEERFRQAFLRGVSALNLEALAVLSGGSGGGGRGDSVDHGGADPPRPSGRLSASGGA